VEAARESLVIVQFCCLRKRLPTRLA